MCFFEHRNVIIIVTWTPLCKDVIRFVCKYISNTTHLSTIVPISPTCLRMRHLLHFRLKLQCENLDHTGSRCCRQKGPMAESKDVKGLLLKNQFPRTLKRAEKGPGNLGIFSTYKGSNLVLHTIFRTYVGSFLIRVAQVVTFYLYCLCIDKVWVTLMTWLGVKNQLCVCLPGFAITDNYRYFTGC